MNYRAVLFDFDYTLGDATEAIFLGFQHASQQMELSMPSLENVRAMVGYLLDDGYTLLSGDESTEGRALFHQYYMDKTRPLQVELTQMLPGAQALLEALHAHSIPIGIVSSKGGEAIEEILTAKCLRHLVSTIVGGHEVKIPKPDPEGILTSLSILGLRPDEVLYCGDTVIDAEAAQRAGVSFCAVLNGVTEAPAFDTYPHVHIAPDLFDLRAWLSL